MNKKRINYDLEETINNYIRFISASVGVKEHGKLPTEEQMNGFVRMIRVNIKNDVIEIKRKLSLKLRKLNVPMSKD